MGILYKLNQLTQSMNETTDSVNGSGNQQFQDNQTVDISKLGNINKDDANRSLTSTADFLQNGDKNIKLLDTTIHNFLDSQSYSQYLQNFLCSLPNFSVMAVDDRIKQQINNKDIFYAQYRHNINFIIMCSTEYAEAQNLVNALIMSNISINNASKVFIGYFNYDSLTLTNAKNSGIEIIGMNEFMEINYDATSNNIQDLKLGSQQNSFKASLGRELREYNKCAKDSNGIKTVMDGVVQSFKDKARLLVTQHVSM